MTYTAAPEGCCEICVKDLGSEPRRSVSTPVGRRPVHESCHKKYMDMDAGLLPPEPTELPLHIVVDPKIDPKRHPEPEEEDMAGKEMTVWDEKFAEMAAQYAQGERAGGDFLSLRGGILTFQDEPLDGNQIVCVVLDAVIERTFYAEKYDPDREFNLPPICYAFGRADDEEDLAPHPSMQADPNYFEPQNDVCSSCPNNQWGTADKGKGKACGERRRLALLPAGYFTPRKGSRDFDMHLITDEDHFKSADIAFLKLPVTSVKEWAKYVLGLSSGHRRPPMAVITKLSVEPHQQHQFHVKFEMIELLKPEMYETIMARHQEAYNSIIQPYSPPGEEAEEAPAPSRSVRRR